MSDVTTWLESLGLEQYAQAFADNDIDWELLPELDHDVLKDIGVSSAGARLRMLASIRSFTDNAERAPNERLSPSNDAATSSTVATPGLPISDAERRQLTVMFCDLVGSTALAEEMDLEDYRDLLGAYQTTSRNAIEHYGGYIARYMGDGLLVYFGYPQAHEDDAERAVRAGLDIVDGIRALGLREKRELTVRIGVATGQVVAGDIIGEGAAEEHAVLGEAPNLAARLQALAAPNAIVVSRTTRRLVGNLFSLESAGHHRLKGFAEAVPIWRVLGSAASATRFAATRSPDTTALVGREAELLVLTERWGRARAHEGQVVLLSGEPGIGKSRLTHALRERVQLGHADVLYFQCSPHHTNSAFYPFVESIQYGVGLAQDDAPEQRLTKLVQWLSRAEDALVEFAPALARLWSTDRDAPTASARGDESAHKQQTIDALIAYVSHATAARPRLMLFEDIQWADPTTLEVLSGIIERAQDMALLLLITHRPEFTPTWQGRGNVTAHSLTRLGRSQVSEMVSSMIESPLPEAVIQDIVTKTDGVPLFVEEFTKTLVEASDETIGDDFGDTRQLVPQTLQDLLVARLDRLGDIKQIAQMAAVIGRDFDYELLAAFSSLNAVDLLDGLSRLEQADLIYRRGTPPAATYSFKHGLLQDAAYDSLLRGDRERLHARLSHLLQTRFPQMSEQVPELLAHHFTVAGQGDLALAYWQRAADLALKRSAYAERLAHLDAAHRVLRTEPNSPERQARELALENARGGTLMATLGYQANETRQAFVRASALAKSLDDARQTFATLRGLHGVHYSCGELTDALEVANECLRLGQGVADSHHIALAHRLVGQTHFMRGELALAREHLEKARTANAEDRTQVAQLTGGGHALMALVFLAQVLWMQGYPEQSIAMAKSALAEAERSFGAFSVATNLFFFCWLLGWRRDYPELRNQSERIRELASEHRILEWDAQAGLLTDWPDLAMDPGPETAELARQRLDPVRAAGGVMAPFKLGLLASAMRTDDPAKGLEIVDEALALTDQGERWSEPELLRVKGQLLIALDDETAEQTLRRAVHIAREQGAKSWELRATTTLCEFLARRGRMREAKEILTPAYEWFNEGFETADRQDARTLLARINTDLGAIG
ncbi:MAG: adenylate/guanylate cyclase domain-containing protein [Pseudomonadota bacterium]